MGCVTDISGGDIEFMQIVQLSSSVSCLLLQFADGSLARLSKLRARCLYIHINNTNPILDRKSAAAAAVRAAGVEIAEDGMEFEV